MSSRGTPFLKNRILLYKYLAYVVMVVSILCQCSSLIRLAVLIITIIVTLFSYKTKSDKIAKDGHSQLKDTFEFFFQHILVDGGEHGCSIVEYSTHEIYISR